MRTTTPSTRAATAVAVSTAVVLGGLVAVQSRVNGQLGVELGSGFLAALVSFGGGLVVLTAAMLVRPSARAGLRDALRSIRRREIPWWYLAGGCAGAFLVLSQGLTAAALGVALFTVAIVCGQTLSSAVIDRVGLGSLTPSPFTSTRILGAVLAVAAVIYAVSARLQTDVPLWTLLLPFLAGAGVGWQQAVNGQVRRHTGSALAATFVNFAVGTSVLLVAFVLDAAIARPTIRPAGEWWLYLGGLVGVTFIAGASVIVHRTGVLVLGLATVSGQLVVSVAIDALAPVAGRTVAASTLIGTALTLVATGIAALPTGRRPVAPDPTAEAR